MSILPVFPTFSVNTRSLKQHAFNLMHVHNWFMLNSEFEGFLLPSSLTFFNKNPAEATYSDMCNLIARMYGFKSLAAFKNSHPDLELPLNKASLNVPILDQFDIVDRAYCNVIESYLDYVNSEQKTLTDIIIEPTLLLSGTLAKRMSLIAIAKNMFECLSILNYLGSRFYKDTGFHTSEDIQLYNRLDPYKHGLVKSTVNFNESNKLKIANLVNTIWDNFRIKMSSTNTLLGHRGINLSKTDLKKNLIEGLKKCNPTIQSVNIDNISADSNLLKYSVLYQTRIEDPSKLHVKDLMKNETIYTFPFDGLLTRYDPVNLNLVQNIQELGTIDCESEEHLSFDFTCFFADGKSETFTLNVYYTLSPKIIFGTRIKLPDNILDTESAPSWDLETQDGLKSKLSMLDLDENFIKQLMNINSLEVKKVAEKNQVLLSGICIYHLCKAYGDLEKFKI